MKRRHYIASLSTGGFDGKTVAMSEKFAKNSAIRASEALVRDHARAVGGPFEGEDPSRHGEEYRRVWVGPSGDRVFITVAEVHS